MRGFGGARGGVSRCLGGGVEGGLWVGGRIILMG